MYIHRPHLAGASVSDWVFLPAHVRGRSDSELGSYKIPTLTLARIVREWTQFYLPGCPGFGPHAFRHIVATEYIKNHKEGFEVAAKILHILQETARKYYSHVKSADYIAEWNDYFESVWAA